MEILLISAAHLDQILIMWNFATLLLKVAQYRLYISALPCPRAAQPMRGELAGFRPGSQSSDLPTRLKIFLFPLPLPTLKCSGKARKDERQKLDWCQVFICLEAFSSQHFHKTWDWGSQLNSHYFCRYYIHQIHLPCHNRSALISSLRYFLLKNLSLLITSSYTA